MSPAEQVAVHHPTVLDDESRQIGRVYAEALFKAGEQAGQQDELLEELKALVGEVFRRDPGLEAFLASPAVSRDRKAEAIRRAFTDRASPVMVRFLLVLNHHDRLGVLRAVADGYARIHEQRARRVPVFVRSALPLNDEERRRIADDVQAVTGLHPVLRETVDPDILGGLTIQIGDWQYDASVRARLRIIRDELIERSSHGIQGGRDRFSSD
jgi:F-type H+-transporting ATPase subunit delta